MTKILTLALALTSFNVFALTECVEFPRAQDNPRSYTAEITKESDTLSFGNCPESLLMQDRYIAQLKQLEKVNGETRCVYAFSRVYITCQK